MEKSRDAFRTISEVAEWLEVPTHVLRFWESRFSQIKPVKRAGGRRYYRPSDMRIIGGVKVLLHDQGMTIRGVQKLFREQGLKHVSSFSPDLYDGLDEDNGGEVIDLRPAAPETPAAPAPAARATREAVPAPEPEAGPAPEPEAEAEPASPSGGLFTHRPRSVPSPQAASAAEAPEPEPAPPAPRSFPTPDVPEIDPEDDDPAFAASASAAARLTTLSRHRLREHREALASAAEGLRKIRDRIL